MKALFEQLKIWENGCLIDVNYSIWGSYMQYLFAPNANYEDYASGRVLYHGAGLATFPVRLASELFQRCLSHYSGERPIDLYDPLCGEAYLLTVLGLLHGEKIRHVYGTDINPEALAIAGHNLSLLTQEGLDKRKVKLTELLESYGKESHRGALKSLENLGATRNQVSRDIPYQVLRRDMLGRQALKEDNFQASIVIADVPYGGLSKWSEKKEKPLHVFLQNLHPVLHSHSIVCLVSHKTQKLSAPESYQRIEHFQVGKRRIHIFRPQTP